MSFKYVDPDKEQQAEESEEQYRQEAARQGMVVATPVAPIFTYALLAAIIAVFVVQVLNPENSKLASGVNALTREGQFWRLITSGTMHGGVFHLFMNGMALYNLGSAIEYLSNRYNLAIAFLFSVFGGSVLSVLLSPNIESVGASGGIAGLLGFIVIYGFKRRKILPRTFLQDMLINVGLLVAIGIFGYGYIDNAAHAGGFITGALYALVQVPGDVSVDPRTSDPVTALFGYASLLTYLGFAVLTILLMTKTIAL